MFWTEALGANVRDADGNVFVDLTAAFGVASAGHRNPRIVAAVRDQADRLIHGMGDVHPPDRKVELLERLGALSPWPESRGVLASAGSEAVEVALKTAQLGTGRTRVVAFEGGYHGLTLGALSVTGRSDFREPFKGRVPESVAFVPFPGVADEVAGAVDELERALAGRGSEGPAAAVILEPMQGRGGIVVPPAGFLTRVAEATRAAGALLVYDEIFTGLGRTGRRFAFEHEEVVPDVLCLGKALGGGLPLSACIGPPDVMDAWPESTGEALHTSTFLGHPLACAAGLAFLDELEREGLARRAREEGDRLIARLREDLGGDPRVLDVRGRGLFVGVELAGGPGAGGRLARRLLADGVIVLPAGPTGDVVEITPPLSIGRAQLDSAVEVFVRRVRDGT